MPYRRRLVPSEKSPADYQLELIDIQLSNEKRFAFRDKALLHFNKSLLQQHLLT